MPLITKFDEDSGDDVLDGESVSDHKEDDDL